MAKKLNKPVFVPSDYDDSLIRCETFGEYVRKTMLPDPTYVILPEETEDLITDMVNAGSIHIRDAIRIVSRNYRYDDDGKEYIEFPEPLRMKQLIHAYTAI